MKKLLVVLFLGLMVLSGCQKKEEVVNNSYYYSFTDSLGNEVVLEKKPERVAVLFSSYAEIWTLAKGEVVATVGDSVTRGFVKEGVELVNDGAGLKIDNEKLIASNPDFLIVTADLSAQVEAYNMLKDMGVPCAAFREENIDDYLSILKIFTDINECPEVYEEYGVKVKEEADKIISDNKGDGPSYLFIRAGSAFNSTRAKTAEDHFACVMIDELGAKNIVEPGNLLTDELSLEEIVNKDPDIILIVCQGKGNDSQLYMESLLKEDGWKDLKAVLNNNYYFVEKDLFNYKPNQKWAAAYKALADILY
ncbi:MAG: ABC transporter substrate-binding protein [Erysipelotrichaceae bacterium]|nr:ABC transporter substrate-binding protein [Erysipelotrichaceae bacterium]